MTLRIMNSNSVKIQTNKQEQLQGKESHVLRRNEIKDFEIQMKNSPKAHPSTLVKC